MKYLALLRSCFRSPSPVAAPPMNLHRIPTNQQLSWLGRAQSRHPTVFRSPTPFRARARRRWSSSTAGCATRRSGQRRSMSSASTNTVVTIDLPGHGLSGMDREGWPLMAFGGDVQAVVEHLDLTDVVLIGHSMGGPVALEAARLMPNRTRGVIAVDSLQDADAKYDPDQFNGFLAAYEQDFAGTCLQFTSSMFLESADPELVERVTSDMCDHSPEISIALLREFFSYELGPALAAVDVPVRYINAPMYPTNVEVNRTYQPDFDGVIMEGVGHFLMMEEPEAFNELLRQVVEGLEQAECTPRHSSPRNRRSRR